MRNDRSGGPVPPRWPRRLVVVATLLLLPKCALCLAGFLAVGTGFVASARELCGPTEAGGIAPADVTLVAGVLVLGSAAWLWWKTRPAVSGRRGPFVKSVQP